MTRDTRDVSLALAQLCASGGKLSVHASWCATVLDEPLCNCDGAVYIVEPNRTEAHGQAPVVRPEDLVDTETEVLRFRLGDQSKHTRNCFRRMAWGDGECECKELEAIFADSVREDLR